MQKKSSNNGNVGILTYGAIVVSNSNQMRTKTIACEIDIE